jgi:DnaJ-class molecular chaperone
MECPTCNGEGKIDMWTYDTICPGCGGTGQVEDPERDGLD